MTNILGRLVIRVEEPPPTKPRDPLIMCSGDNVTNEKSYIFSSNRLMATKFDREVASDEKVLSSKSHNLLMMWTDQVT